MTQRYWHIVGYDSSEKIFEKKVKLGCYSENQIEQLLMALAARAGLDFDEIMGAYAKRGTKVANDLLDVHRDGFHATVMCGTNPYFIAKVTKDGS